MSARDHYTNRNGVRRERQQARRLARRGKAAQRALADASYARLMLAEGLGYEW